MLRKFKHYLSASRPDESSRNEDVSRSTSNLYSSNKRRAAGMREVRLGTAGSRVEPLPRRVAQACSSSATYRLVFFWEGVEACRRMARLSAMC